MSEDNILKRLMSNNRVKSIYRHKGLFIVLEDGSDIEGLYDLSIYDSTGTLVHYNYWSGGIVERAENEFLVDIVSSLGEDNGAIILYNGEEGWFEMASMLAVRTLAGDYVFQNAGDRIKCWFEGRLLWEEETTELYGANTELILYHNNIVASTVFSKTGFDILASIDDRGIPVIGQYTNEKVEVQDDYKKISLVEEYSR